MILIVDDNMANRKLARVLFEGEGYRVLTAGDAEEAERLLKRGPLPSVILLDLQLPGVDGLELASRIKANPDYADILIVAVTAYAMKGDEERALAICDAYVAKPIDTQTLPRRIRDLVLAAREAKEPQDQATILVVEDNQTTRKLFRVALQIAGYQVLEAGDGASARALMTDSRVDLILQDLNLPDTDGIDLVEELRRLPGGANLPVVALSGFMQRLEDARIMGAGFSAFLVKPVEPGRLSQVVDSLLATRETGSELELSPLRTRRRLLVADDDPIQLKLLRLQLSEAGFEVRTVGGGEALLREARANPPDAIVSDILMPGQDGFELCLALRNDPRLAGVPVVLVSSHYGEDLDQELARSVGASGLLSRSMGFGDVTAGIRACLSEARDPPAPEIADLSLNHRDRIVRQLERQVVARAGFEQRCALQAAQLTVLGAATEALSRGTDLGASLQSVLGFCFDAAAISKGVLYLREPGGGLSVGHVIGYLAGGALDDFFGHIALLEQIAQSQAVVRLPSPMVPQATAEEILIRARVTEALLVPLVSQGSDLGVLFLGLPSSQFELPVLLRFAETLGAQIGQAVGLARSFERVAQSEQRWRSLLENASSGFLVIDLADGVAREANPYASRLFGRSRAQLVGRHIKELLPSGEGARVARALKELSAGGSPKQMELRLESPGGADVLVSLSEVAWDEGRAALLVLSDVTAQRALQQQLLHSQKLEAIGQLAGGIAHDFNNMLMPIMGFAEMARETLEVGHPAHRYLNQIARAADRSATLTSQILAFARRQVLEPEVADLGHVVESCAPMLRRLIGEDVEIIVRRSGEALAEIDAGQFEQVVLNLTINARDAMPTGGLLTIETSKVELAEDDPARPEGVPAGRYALLSAADTGQGMNEDTLKRLFDPFFTTKPEGKGTGLGLSVVHGIIAQSGGFLSVASELDAGTTFRIYLPSVREKDRSAIPTPLSGLRQPSGGLGERILLVEDEELVRLLLSESLRAAGYEVFVAEDGEEALEISANLDLELHVLLTDCVMPGIGGVDLARRLVVLRPELAVVFMSGYPPQDVFKDARGLPRAPVFVRKPVTPRVLLPKIREVLDPAEG